MGYNRDYLQKVAGGGPKGTQLWIYGPPTGSSQADAVATVRGAGYIDDGGPGNASGYASRGMRLNDVVISVDTSTPLVAFSRVSAISAVGAVTMTA